MTADGTPFIDDTTPVPVKRGRGQPRISPGEASTSIRFVLAESVKARIPNEKRGDVSEFCRDAVAEKLARMGL